MSLKEPRIPGYHSETIYSYRGSQASDIIRVCSFPRKDWECAVVWFDTKEHLAVRGLRSDTARKSTTGIGNLDNLPLELLQYVILELDMASLFRFRQTSYRARQSVDSLREYRLVAEHALNAFRALIRTSLARNITLASFYRLLCTERCEGCSNFGNLMHLPTRIRCCTPCLLRSPLPSLRMASLSKVKRALNLSKEQLADLPVLKTLPGKYSWDLVDEKVYKSRVSLVPLQSALTAYNQQHPEDTIRSRMADQFNQRPIWEVMSCCALPAVSSTSNESFAGVSCAGCQLAQEVTYSFPGQLCRFRDRLYSKASFLEHFVWCQYGQNLWTSSNGGTQPPTGYPYFCVSASKHRESWTQAPQSISSSN
jgi:hypothetical protein